MADEDENKNQDIPPPPPPPPSEGAENYQEEGYAPEPPPIYEEEGVEEAAGPAVAATAGKNMVLILIGGALGLFLLYQIFFSGDDEVAPPPPPPSQGNGATVAPAGDITIPIEPIRPLPPPPPLEPIQEALPELPPPPPAPPDIDFIGEGPTNEELKRRRSSEMLIVNGSREQGEEKEDDKGVTSAAERAVATTVGDLDHLVLQGKIIHAVLETALDTTLAGPLRAVTTRDVYAESGYDVLIPKGSRLIGTYNTDVVRGQGRVFIIWSRLIRPDGVDVQINSQAIDRLGRSGINGYVDDRYFEIFGGAILTSVLGITLAGIADAILDPEGSSETESSSGSTTTTGNSVDSAISESVTSIGSVSKSVVGGLLDARPSITVDQGTPLKVFVNRDLEFPSEVAGKGVNIIQ